MSDGTELAFVHYLDLTASAAYISEASQKYHKEQEDHLYIDPLTKLPNINYLHEFGEEKIKADLIKTSLSYYSLMFAACRIITPNMAIKLVTNYSS